MEIDFTKRVQKYVNVDSHLDAVEAGATIVQLKYDGWWARVVVKSKIAFIYSRQNELKGKRRVNLPDCVLIGEFLKGTQRVVAGTEGKHSTLMAFDILELEGKETDSLPYYQRLNNLTNLLERNECWVELCETFPIEQSAFLWDKFVEKGNVEGLVYKKKTMPYVGSTVWRRKKQFTMDYVVMGFYEGKGKHSGRLGGLVCGLFVNGVLTEKTKVGGGFNDKERKGIWDNQAHYLGKVLEVTGWQIFESGAMRHPNAVRWGDGELAWRSDKNPSECTWAS
jgi:ATP-dependent DNA ligase